MINLSELNIIGLTGMSGAGKSMAADVFAKNGFYVINCDEEARRVISNPPCGGAVKAAFPEMFPDDKFDRKKAAELVFSSPVKMQKYEKIIYPFIVYKIVEIILDYAEAGRRDFLLDAPTLYQSGADDFCKKIIAVIADKKICAERISARDNISEANAFLRLDSQPDAEYFKDKADAFIENNTDINSFLLNTERIITEMK